MSTHLTPFLRSPVGTVEHWDSKDKDEINKIRLYLTQRCYTLGAKVKNTMILGYEALSGKPIYVLKSVVIKSAGPLKNDKRGRPTDKKKKS